MLTNEALRLEPHVRMCTSDNDILLQVPICRILMILRQTNEDHRSSSEFRNARTVFECPISEYIRS